MIELTIKLDTDKVEEAIRAAWQKEFQVPDRYTGTAPGAGWQEVMRQVRAHIETLDLSSYISRIAKAKLDDVVNEAVTIALREKAKQRVKAMMIDGSLLNE